MTLGNPVEPTTLWLSRMIESFTFSVQKLQWMPPPNCASPDSTITRSRVVAAASMTPPLRMDQVAGRGEVGEVELGESDALDYAVVHVRVDEGGGASWPRIESAPPSSSSTSRSPVRFWASSPSIVSL